MLVAVFDTQQLGSPPFFFGFWHMTAARLPQDEVAAAGLRSLEKRVASVPNAAQEFLQVRGRSPDGLRQQQRPDMPGSLQACGRTCRTMCAQRCTRTEPAVLAGGRHIGVRDHPDQPAGAPGAARGGRGPACRVRAQAARAHLRRLHVSLLARQHRADLQLAMKELSLAKIGNSVSDRVSRGARRAPQ